MVLPASLVSAAVITIDQGEVFSANYDNGGMGNGRGVSFLANENFTISSIGFDLSVISTDATNYVYQIFSSTNGSDAVSILDFVTFNLTAGEGYRDQAFGFTFNSGSHYLVNFARADGAHLGDLGTHYVWEDLNGVSAAINYGPLTVVEGFEGSPPNNSNPLIAFTRFNAGTPAVPEPATWAFMIFGFGAIGGAMRRQRKANVKVSYA